MATAEKHRKRSHRSYKQEQANLQGFRRTAYAKSQQKKAERENKSAFASMFGKFKRKKGDK